ncbi:MAG: AraC family transcriptional regulator [Bacteroidia bacterium]|nr:AraC family transcriptional regulator [Bacteroidia bacterium]
MIFEQHTPTGLLSEFIENIVFYDGYSAQHLVDKLLPDGSINLLMDMSNKPSKLYHDIELKKCTDFNGSFISGQHKAFILIEANHSSMMVTRFKPGGAYPFFDFPISKLNDTVKQLEPIWGDKVEKIRKAILIEKEIKKKFELVEEFYLSQLNKNIKRDESFEKVLYHLSENPQQSSIKELAEIMQVSQKHLITLFDKRVGLKPKYLARIYRFQKAIKKLEHQDKIDWIDLAHECGYYDQSHFIRDFLEFSGINPSDYPHLKGEYMNYIPLGTR